MDDDIRGDFPLLLLSADFGCIMRYIFCPKNKKNKKNDIK